MNNIEADARCDVCGYLLTHCSCVGSPRSNRVRRTRTEFCVMWAEEDEPLMTYDDKDEALAVAAMGNAVAYKRRVTDWEPVGK